MYNAGLTDFFKMESYLAGIYKNRYTSGESVIKIGALYHKYRYIFVINIGTHTNICNKNRYVPQKCDKIGTHVIQIGTI